MRESFGLCDACGMASNTEDSRVWQLRLDGRGVIGACVLCLGPMASFAVHVSVFTRFLCFGDVDVTCLTCFVTCKTHRTRGNFAHCCSAIVSVLAEARRYNKMADYQKQQKSKDKEAGEPEQMTCILKSTHETPLPNLCGQRTARLSRCQSSCSTRGDGSGSAGNVVCELNHISV